MVIEGKPQQGMRRVSGKQFRNDAQAIEIGRNAGQRNQGSVSWFEIKAVGENPSGEEVSDWTHEVWPLRLLDFNQHITVFNLQWIHGNFHAGVLLGGAGLWVVLPAVPGAHDLAAFDHSLAQRAAAMETDIVHGAVGAVHIRDADGLVAAGEFFGFVGGWEFGFGGELDEVRRHEDRLYRNKSVPTVCFQ